MSRKNNDTPLNIIGINIDLRPTRFCIRLAEERNISIQEFLVLLRQRRMGLIKVFQFSWVDTMTNDRYLEWFLLVH